MAPPRSPHSLPRIRPAQVEIHYNSGIGYWAKIDGEDAGIYDPDWPRFCRSLGEQLAAVNLLHG